MTSTAEPHPRRGPRFGGFSATFVRLEVRRMLRNRRTLIFTLVLPSVFFLMFGSSSSYRTERVSNGNVTAYLLVSMAVYGAMLATTTAGASVSLERAAGWSRQLRLTPMRPLAYIAVKLVVAMTLGVSAVVTVLVFGSFFGARMTGPAWVLCGALACLLSVVFAAFGLLMGYLLPSENVMQILGLVLAAMSFVGGLFIPLSQLSHPFAQIATYTPVYGVGVVARYPLTQEGNLVVAVANVLVWTLLFSLGAAWRFRRDTARV